MGAIQRWTFANASAISLEVREQNEKRQTENREEIKSMSDNTP